MTLVRMEPSSRVIRIDGADVLHRRPGEGISLRYSRGLWRRERPHGKCGTHGNSGIVAAMEPRWLWEKRMSTERPRNAYESPDRGCRIHPREAMNRTSLFQAPVVPSNPAGPGVTCRSTSCLT